MSPSKVRGLLMYQHGEVRRALAAARAVADRYRVGGAGSPELRTAVQRLKSLLSLHNATEEELLGPLLREDYAWGAARVARMMEEHGAEHAQIEAALTGSLDTVAANIPEFVEMIDAHMAAEERTFLAKSVLRDSLVAVDDAG